MIYNLPVKQKLRPKHFYAMLGLSEPKIKDYNTGSYVSFRLNENEKEILIVQIDYICSSFVALEQAKEFFQNSYSEGKIYFKRSRYYKSAKLYQLDYEEELKRFRCRTEKF